MDAAVQTWNLTKRYEELVAVDRLNLTVNKGEIFGLLGPNGAGKTTTILMLMGLTEPTSGQARVYGYDPIREPLRVKRLAGYLAENFGFYEDLTAEQNLSYVARLNGIPFNEAEEKIYDLLDLVGLSDVAEMEVSKFSRGMKQRLGMADVLLKNPEVLFLDEPTAGIDPEGVRRILDIIVKLSREDGKTILVSSHLLYQVQRICDRVGIFVKGRMVAEGPIQRLGREVIEKGKVTLEVDVPEAPRELADEIASVEGVLSVDRSGDSFVIECSTDLSGTISKMIIDGGYTLSQMKRQEYTLDEIYSRYFAGEPET